MLVSKGIEKKVFRPSCRSHGSLLIVSKILCTPASSRRQGSLSRLGHHWPFVHDDDSTVRIVEERTEEPATIFPLATDGPPAVPTVCRVSPAVSGSTSKPACCLHIQRFLVARSRRSLSLASGLAPEASIMIPLGYFK